jgi:heptosyltransferase I
MERILVYHPAAIGDSVLATPVAAQLRAAFPQSRISWVCHGSLSELLGLCPAINELIPAESEDLKSRLQAVKPDLVVDLSGSFKSFLQTLFLAKTTRHYKKKEKSMHVVDNYLETIAGLGEKQEASKIFPTLFVPEAEKDKIRQMLPREHRRLLALVPGVGSLRPHRAWPEDQWGALAKNILWEKDHALILIGGQEERTMCSRIAERAGEYCFNLAGKLSLRESAAALSVCDAIVSSDTGPAHVSSAVGTPVVGLYGPTTVARSGSWGNAELALSVSDQCRCGGQKWCRYNEGAGKCMNEIRMKVVYGNLSSLFPWNRV